MRISRRPTITTMPRRAVMRRATVASAAMHVPRAGLESAAMRTVLVREHGGFDKLEITEVPDPVAGPGEALIDVRAVALNHLDVWLLRGVPRPQVPLPDDPRSVVPGSL